MSVNENFNLSFDSSLNPVDFITFMFERTDEDSFLFIPGWHYDRLGWEYGVQGSTDENDSYRCRVDWNLNKYEKLLEKFNRHYAAIKKIALCWNELDGTADTAKSVLKDADLFEFWNTYIRSFDIGDIDIEKIRDIDDRLDTIEWVKSIASTVSKGKAVADFEKEALSEYIDIVVTDEEIAYREKYIDNILKDAQNRIGKNICAYDVIIRTARLCRLMSLEATARR